MVYFINLKTNDLFLKFVVHEGGSTLSTVVTIMVLGHEASNSGNRTVLAKSYNLAITLYSVILKSGKRNILGPPLNLLRLGENLLFTLLSSSTKTKDEMKSRLLLDVVVGESAAILKLLSGEDETLLIRWDSLLVLDLGLYVVNGV